MLHESRPCRHMLHCMVSTIYTPMLIPLSRMEVVVWRSAGFTNWSLLQLKVMINDSRGLDQPKDDENGNQLRASCHKSWVLRSVTSIAKLGLPSVQHACSPSLRSSNTEVVAALPARGSATRGTG